MNLPAVIGDKGGGGNQVVTWCQNVGLLLKSGVSVDSAVELSWHQTGDGPFKRDLDMLLSHLLSGRSLAASMSKYDDWFPNSLVQAVHAGEKSGQLAEVLLRWSKGEELRKRLKTQMIGSLVYPACVLITTTAVFSFLVLCILPKLVGIYGAHGGSLPWLTTGLIKLTSAILTPYSFLLLGIAALLSFLTLRRYSDSELFVKTILRIPVVGPLWKSYLIGDFCQYLSLFIAGGIPVPKALSLCGLVSDNSLLKSCALQAEEDVRVGRNLVAALEETSFFPADVLSLINAGSETNQLEKVLSQAAKAHNNMVQTGTTAVVSFIEPAVIALMGAVVAIMVLAIYLPILRLTAVIVQ